MRDAAFSRQRYWGEPFPIVWKDGIAYPLDENELPLELPHVESYKPGPEGEGPLANITRMEHSTSEFRETNTMPGYAGIAGIFCVTWIRITIKHFVIKRSVITGTG